ncbi:MAG: malate synthase G, partial [Alphaproteobacteria bacterium]|nr:malate synthase G [Alphaproteobacteria bacterium]
MTDRVTDRIERHGLQVATIMDDLVADKVLPGTGVETDAFWQSFAAIIRDLAPKNKALLAEREDIQAKIDAWHLARQSQQID